MKIRFNGKNLTIPAEYERKMVTQLYTMGVQEYNEKVPLEWSIRAKPFTRAVLGMMEQYAEKHYGRENAKTFRPERRADPNVFLIGLIGQFLLRGLQYVTISLDTETDSAAEGECVTAFSVAIDSIGFARRQMDTDGVERVRKDNSTQVP